MQPCDPQNLIDPPSEPSQILEGLYEKSSLFECQCILNESTNWEH